GEGAGLLRARRTGAVVDGQEVDLGLVGEVTGVDPTAILDVIESGRIPVVSSVAPEINDDGEPTGQVLNVNADTAAAAVVDGRRPHSMLLEVFTSAGVGTQVVPDAEPTAPTTPEEDA
ncbi:hypothetical protein F3W83_15785, partial [Micrococcus luteus]|nr:hypothetical protein [Micrococcus luteus]